MAILGNNIEISKEIKNRATIKLSNPNAKHMLPPIKASPYDNIYIPMFTEKLFTIAGYRNNLNVHQWTNG